MKNWGWGWGWAQPQPKPQPQLYKENNFLNLIQYSH